MLLIPLHYLFKLDWNAPKSAFLAASLQLQKLFASRDLNKFWMILAFPVLLFPVFVWVQTLHCPRISVKA